MVQYLTNLLEKSTNVISPSMQIVVIELNYKLHEVMSIVHVKMDSSHIPIKQFAMFSSIALMENILKFCAQLVCILMNILAHVFGPMQLKELDVIQRKVRTLQRFNYIKYTKHSFKLSQRNLKTDFPVQKTTKMMHRDKLLLILNSLIPLIARNSTCA